MAAAALALHECGLALEDGEGLLEALDLGRAARLALLVALRLRDAAVLDLGVVRVHGVELLLGGGAVAGYLGDGLLLGFMFIIILVIDFEGIYTYIYIYIYMPFILLLL